MIFKLTKNSSQMLVKHLHHKIKADVIRKLRLTGSSNSDLNFKPVSMRSSELKTKKLANLV